MTAVACFASLSRLFSQWASSKNLPFMVEGGGDPDPRLFQTNNVCLRVEGPYRGHEIDRYEIAVSLTEVGTGQNAFNLHALAAEVIGIIESGIPVVNIPNDPTHHLGCLLVDPQREGNPRLINLNTLSHSAKVRQIAVQARLIFEV